MKQEQFRNAYIFQYKNEKTLKKMISASKQCEKQHCMVKIHIKHRTPKPRKGFHPLLQFHYRVTAVVHAFIQNLSIYSIPYCEYFFQSSFRAKFSLKLLYWNYLVKLKSILCRVANCVCGKKKKKKKKSVAKCRVDIRCHGGIQCKS